MEKLVYIEHLHAFAILVVHELPESCFVLIKKEQTVLLKLRHACEEFCVKHFFSLGEACSLCLTSFFKQMPKCSSVVPMVIVS